MSYIAYLLEAPQLSLGEWIPCGAFLGRIGQSGNMLNAYLRLKLRAAPSGMRIAGIDHYNTHASSIEMANYSLCRVSSLFPPIDPMQWLTHLS